MMQKKNRAFLKWAGGKYSLVEHIQARLPQANKLIEPFVGAGSVFLNTHYKRYLLNDINPDLINLYNFLKAQPDALINDARDFFSNARNNEPMYYALREEFNKTEDEYYRAILFLYLNRHGYNGLCRYRLQGRVIYCDPPYAPISKTAAFTSYASHSFGQEAQEKLAKLAAKTSQQRGIPVLVSNHDLPLTRDLYQGADFSMLSVKRSISQNGAKRNPVDEILAFFPPVEPSVKKANGMRKAKKPALNLSAVKESKSATS